MSRQTKEGMTTSRQAPVTPPHTTPNRKPLLVTAAQLRDLNFDMRPVYKVAYATEAAFQEAVHIAHMDKRSALVSLQRTTEPSSLEMSELPISESA